MRQIKATLDIIGYPGATHVEYFEVEDDMTEDQINNMIWENMMPYVDIYFEDGSEEEDYGG